MVVLVEEGDISNTLEAEGGCGEPTEIGGGGVLERIGLPTVSIDVEFQN